MTTRRDVLMALPLACVAFPGLAQTPRPRLTKRLGVLGSGADPPVPPPQRPMFVELRQKGWILGDNLLRDAAYADWNIDRLPGYAEALVHKQVDAIFAVGQESAVAVARATKKIPIVFVGVPWPQEAGLIESDARPGRNVTGHAYYAGTEVALKRAQFLLEMRPQAKRIAWLIDSEQDSVATVAGGRWNPRQTIEPIVNSLGLEAEWFPVSKPQDVDGAFAQLVAWRADMVIANGWQIWQARERFLDLLVSHRLPSAFFGRHWIEVGGLLAYTPAETYAMPLSDYFDRIFRGAPPSELPVERPRRYELVINIKTAEALGLKIPQSLLARADEIIR
jgi:putative ABC transport system substrate-binding protein